MAAYFLLVTPQGGKLWRLAYRFAGKQKTLAIGEYPTVGLADARTKREEAKRQLANGIDPSAAKKAAKAATQHAAANSFEVIAREWHGTHMANKTEDHELNSVPIVNVHYKQCQDIMATSNMIYTPSSVL